MMNPTMFVPIALEAWYSDEGNDFLFQTELENYLQNYSPCFSQQPQQRLFQTGDKGYGLVDYELYIPKEWFSEDYSRLREECYIPEEKIFATKNEIAQHLLSQVIGSGQFQIQWVGCDAAYRNDHVFLDGLELPKSPAKWSVQE